MINVSLSYNPYEMKTQMSVDSQDICSINEYSKFRQFIESGTPIQTWMDPIDYKEWKGILNELVSMDDNESVTFNFSGREIELNDLKRACEAQNSDREPGCKIRVVFNHVKVIDDIELSENAEKVYQELLSDRFKRLVSERSNNSEVVERYKSLERNYRLTKEKDFQIVFSGIYSSGKSTIINALVGHRILPSGNNTCTANNCEIRHTPGLGKKVFLKALDDNGGVVVEEMIFDNDDDFRKKFTEISYVDKEKEIDSPYGNVDKMVVGVDLSHLYPQKGRKEIEKKFTIVIVDTPGVNSSATQHEEINEHAAAALEAIADESMPMVVFCVDSGSLEDESIGTFLKDIIERTGTDGNKFNERFLFLANKCDDIENDNDDDDVLKKAKLVFSKYLTTPQKWGMPENTHIGFEPRMFFTASLASLAIAIGVTEPEKDLSRKKVLFRNYEDFKESIIDYEDSNYFLTNECSIPEYRKDLITEEFNKSIENNDVVRAVELQTGIPALVIAIQDYILRYAYPIRVKALLNTFDDILIDVQSSTEQLFKNLDEAEKCLGENLDLKEQMQKKKKERETEEQKLVQVKRKINEDKSRLDGLEDTDVFNKLLRELDAAINQIASMVPRDETISSKESQQQLINKAEAKMQQINSSFIAVNKKYIPRLEEAIDSQSVELERIVELLRGTAREIEVSGLTLGGKSFSDTCSFRSFISDISLKKMSIQMGNEYTVQEKKKEWTESKWRIKRWFGRVTGLDTVNVTKWTSGKISWQPVREQFTRLTGEYQIVFKSLSDQYNERIKTVKDNAKNLLNKLSSDLEVCKKEIEEQNQRIEKLTENIDRLKEEKERYSDDANWLAEMKKKIEEI